MIDDGAMDRLDDSTATRVLDAVLALSLAVRDLAAADVRAAAQAALDAAGGDPLVTLTVAAALIRVEEPVDPWWQRLSVVHLDVEAGRRHVHGVSPDADCARPNWQTVGAHEDTEQALCPACRAWRGMQTPSRRREAAA